MLQRNCLYWHDIIQSGLHPATLPEQCKISYADARCLPLPDASLELLVTSPPYAICYEYKEIHQLTQLWFEQYGILCPHDTNTHDAWIGSKGVSQRAQPAETALPHTGSRSADAALHTLASLAHGPIAQGVQREIRALRYYFQDMQKALRECARVTVPGKHVVFIVGDSYRRGITIPTSNALCEMAESLGLLLERDIVRKIPVRVLVSTRDRTTGRFSSAAQSDTQVYPEEHVLIFRRTH